MDTVVDDRGIRTPGRWLRQSIAWGEVRQFSPQSGMRKPVLVLANGKRKKLGYVPDSAREQIQQRWLRATQVEAPFEG